MQIKIYTNIYFIKLREQGQIIDYIIIKQRSKFKVQDTRVFRKFECGSDHYIVKDRTESLFNYKATDQSTIKQKEPGRAARFKLTGLYDDSSNDLYYWGSDNELNKVYISQDKGALYRDMIESTKKQPMNP